MCLVTGFQTKQQALQFEWAVKHVPPRNAGGVANRLKKLCTTLSKAHWTSKAPPAHTVPLRLEWCIPRPADTMPMPEYITEAHTAHTAHTAPHMRVYVRLGEDTSPPTAAVITYADAHASHPVPVDAQTTSCDSISTLALPVQLYLSFSDEEMMTIAVMNTERELTAVMQRLSMMRTHLLPPNDILHAVFSRTPQRGLTTPTQWLHTIEGLGTRTPLGREGPKVYVIDTIDTINN